MSRTSLLLRRVLPAVAVVVALAAVTTACDWAQPPAVTGKGFNVSGSSFAKLIKVTKKDNNLKDPTTGKKLTVLNPSQIADMLTLRISGQFFLNELASRHLKVNATDETQAQSQISQSSSGTAWPRAYRDWLAHAIAAQDAVLADINKVAGSKRIAAEQALYEQTKDQNKQTCVNYVATTDQAVATTAATAVKGGTSFADAITAAQNTDPAAQGSNTAPQCLSDTDLLSLSQTQADLANAISNSAVGVVVGPVTSQAQDSSGAPLTAYYVVRVETRGVPTFEQMQSQLDQQYAQTVVQGLRDKAFAAARISIDPRYGTWNAKQFVVTAPGGLAAAQTKLLDVNSPTNSSSNSTTDLSGLTGATGG